MTEVNIMERKRERKKSAYSTLTKNQFILEQVVKSSANEILLKTKQKKHTLVGLLIFEAYFMTGRF